MSSPNDNHNHARKKSPIKNATSTVQHATNKVQGATQNAFHKLGGGMNKLGLGIEKATKSVTKSAVVSARNAGLVKTKSSSSNRIGLYDYSNDGSRSETDSAQSNSKSNHQQDPEFSNESTELVDTTTTNVNVNNIKFQAHDFHALRANDPSGNNNFYKYYHLGKLLYKTEYCRIYVCRSHMTKKERVVKIVRETCGTCHEFEVLKNTDHPNLPVVYELFQGKGFEFFIVMKYCEGGTLASFLDKKRSALAEAIQARIRGVEQFNNKDSKQHLNANHPSHNNHNHNAQHHGHHRKHHQNHNKTMVGQGTGVSLPNFEQKRDNQWDLALGKRGDANQSPAVRDGRQGRSPTRRDNRRKSPNAKRGGGDDLNGISEHEREGASNSPNQSPNRRAWTKSAPKCKERPLKEEDAKMIMLQLLGCIRYLHENKIVHCDIKCGNIMFNYLKDFCTVTIVDFDTAFAQDDPDEKITYQRASGMGKDAAYLAPEVVEEEPCYGSKSDIWSAGVTLYKMLTNTLPFVRAETDDEQTIRRNILANPKVAFPENDWCGISEEAKDFVKFLMHPRPFERPSARQAVNHQWLSSARDRMTEVFDEKDSGAKKILHNMRKFNAADTKMKEAVCAYIASHLLTKEEIQPIDRVFKALDSQHDGKIRPYEIKQAFYRVYNKLISEKELKKIMTRIDLNGNGDLSYSEFSMAAVSREDLLSPPRLKMAFEMFDKQNKGYVTHDELRAAFRLVEMDMDYLNKIIKTVDKDGDGKISFAEFVIMMNEAEQ